VATPDQVEEFLRQIRDKARAFEIRYRPRGKNIQGVADIDIIPMKRDEIISNLNYKNYYKGPNSDTHTPPGPDYYEFGVIIKGIEVYIKLALGLPNKPVDCMSFHKAEKPITYPLKNK